jgi:two-component system, NtrC family, sensor histidine kinase HydH
MLGRRLAWATGLRLLFLAAVLAAAGAFYLRGDLAQYRFTTRVGFSVIAFGFVAAASFATWLRWGRGLKAQALSQIVVDQCTWTLVAYLTGGATSGAASLYALSTLMGSLIAGARGAVVAASIGVSLYATLCAASYRGWLTSPPDQAPSSFASAGDAIAFSFLLNTLGIVVVALLAGYLAERIQTTRGALERAEGRALAAERLALLGRVAAGLAHEIRNPLGAIAGSIELLREAPALSQEDRDLCAIVSREATRLEELVTDMMSLAHPRAASFEATEIGAIVMDVVTLAAGSPRAAAGDVVVVLKALPPNPSSRVHADPAQLRQVLWNVVRNAIEVTPAGGSVRVDITETASHVELSVCDNGPGIAPEARARIFDAFYTTRTQGAGLGLAVVRRIMDEHRSVGASIEVVDGEPSGTCFRIRLARARDSAG